MKAEFKGYIHIHSNFSYDGKNSIGELAAFFRARQYRFICLTEHADDFCQEKMAAFLRECGKHVRADFAVIPGLEYRCKDLVHILAIGTTTYFPLEDPLQVALQIRKNEGLAIIAHPNGYERNLSDELVRNVDGCEIWNGQKDSRFIPHWKNLQMFKSLLQINPSLIALGGGDIHSLESYFPLDTRIECGLERISLFGLRRGIQRIEGRYWLLRPRLDLNCKNLQMLKILRLILKTGKIVLAR